MLCIQQKPKLSFILLLKCALKILFFCLTQRRHHHQRRISPIKPHIEHSLNMHSAPFETLPLQLCADIGFELVQPGEERRDMGRCVERRRGFL